MSANVIAVVGSNGKTTTKAMIHHILSERWKGQCSPKSFNNEIGVPLTLLSCEPADEYLVVEVGTNAPGEVAALAELIHPDMAVLTCISEEHLERLGDLNGVAAEECSILHKLEPGGFAAVNVDAPVVRRHLPDGGVTVATFGWNSEADVRLTEARARSAWLHLTINGVSGTGCRWPGCTMRSTPRGDYAGPAAGYGAQRYCGPAGAVRVAADAYRDAGVRRHNAG